MPVSLQRVPGTITEPVSLDDMKNALRVDFTDDDALIGGLITAARYHAESLTGRSLVNQQWIYNLDNFPYWCFAGGQYAPSLPAPSTWNNGAMNTRWLEYVTIDIPRPPLVTLDSIKFIDQNYEQQTLDTSQYVVDTASEPARVLPAANLSWPVTAYVPNAVTLSFTAGYDSVPEPIKVAIRLMVTNWYENRADSATVPKAAEYILSSYRAQGLGIR